MIFADFELLPIPPLDGGRIPDAFLPARLRPAWHTLPRAARVGLVLPVLLGVGLFARPPAAVETRLEAIARRAAG